MADHLRKRIRSATATTLTGLTTTASRVYTSRAYPLQDANLPALRITTPSEQSEMVSMGIGNRTVQRTMTLQVDAVVKSVSGFEDTCDQIAKEVEIALANDNTLGGLCKYIQLRSTATEISGEAEKPIAVTTMLFDVLYLASLNAPDVST